MSKVSVDPVNLSTKLWFQRESSIVHSLESLRFLKRFFQARLVLDGLHFLAKSLHCVKVLRIILFGFMLCGPGMGSLTVGLLNLAIYGDCLFCLVSDDLAQSSFPLKPLMTLRMWR